LTFIQNQYNIIVDKTKGDLLVKRLVDVSVEEFKKLLLSKKIRPASLEDVNGTHHKKKLYKHPNTGQYYVAVK
jgi:hypothetical protein